MAYKLQYMLLADGVQQMGHGKLNILGTFDQITASAVPTRHPTVVLVALLIAETEDELGEHQFSVRILRPNHKQIAETGTRMKIVPAVGSWSIATIRLVIGVQQLPIKEYGRHKVQLLVDGEVVGEHPLNVVRPTPQARA